MTDSVTGDRQTQEQPPASPRLQLLHAHLGLLVASSIVALGLLKLLVLANWDTETAAAVLQHSGTTDVVLGAAVVSARTFIVPLFWLPLLAALYRRATLGKWPAYWIAFVVPPTATLALFASEVWLVLVVIAVSTFTVLEGRWHRRLLPDPATVAWNSVVPSLTMLATFVVTEVVLSDETSWLPAEAITVNSEPAFTGYVLAGDEDSAWVVLRDDPRRVEFIQSSLEREHTLCDPSSDGLLNKSLGELLRTERPADYPDCP